MPKITSTIISVGPAYCFVRNPNGGKDIFLSCKKVENQFGVNRRDLAEGDSITAWVDQERKGLEVTEILDMPGKKRDFKQYRRQTIGTGHVREYFPERRWGWLTVIGERHPLFFHSEGSPDIDTSQFIPGKSFGFEIVHGNNGKLKAVNLYPL